MTQKTETIRDKFEDTLVEGLKGSPIVSKDGELERDADGTVVRVVPEPSFLSVVRAYLKDRASPDQPPLPASGKPAGPLADFAQRHGLPFGASKTPQ